MSQERPTATAQLVTLGIENEVFAVPVEMVLEILDTRRVTKLPDAPAWILGLIDVRGRSVPVMDLRTRLGLPRVPATEHSRILVLDVPGDGGRLVAGLVVDRVFEITALDPPGAEPPPDMGGAWRSDHVCAVGRRNEGFVIILNVPHLLRGTEAVPA
ncbi:chemotaxis protein CheW [Paracraurococcus lichenis]|uniref:Chemotaxis protein CheW n=1 Tax=Paracraurococcus lichenis TaxID=3064888 RepID=A0ABT9E444_9PROT|nr:chemotaxis protein CheW [Paracraurococcus sp. LOR1-02]MDO9710928.1 chemotaxis protein CheW [Paracraurococcus sp. LOR1-02]